MGKEKSLKLNLSVMRIVSCCAIILLHVCSSLIEMYNSQVPMTAEMSAFYYVCKNMMKWAVPVFIMITGVLLLDLDKKVTVEDILKKYVLRMLEVLLVFGLPMAVIREYYIAGTMNLQVILASLTDILTMHSWDHLWYIYSLIGIYLTLPVIRHFVKQASKEEMKLVMVSLFVLTLVIPFIMRLVPEGYLSIVPLSYWFFYLLLGKYLYDDYVEGSLKRNVWLILGGVSAIAVLIWGILAPAYADALFTYNNPLIALMAAAVFVLFCPVKVSEKYSRIVWELDRLCFCSYLIHPVFIHITYQFLKIRPIDFMSFYIPATAGFFILFTVMTFAISWLLRRIPLVRKIT